MPSLRRTFSSPTVRSSPYSHPLYPSSMTRPGGSNPRRSSGSDIAERRVLADLDWWRVEEGQHELRGEVPPPSQLPNPADTEEEQEQVPEVISPLPSPPRDLNVNTDPLWAPLPGSGSSAVESSDFSHVHYFLGMNYETFGTTEPLPTFNPFSILSISDRTPGRRRLTVSSDSSGSSLESSPEPTRLSLSPMDDMGFADIVPLVAEDSLYSTLSRSTRRAPALGIRSVSYSFVESELSKGHDDRFGDLSPSSPFSSFSPSKPDFEDLFY